METIVKEPGQVESLVFDYKNEKMYWTEWFSIRKANFNGTNEEILIKYNTNRYIDGLAIDTLNRRIFWAERLPGEFPKMFSMGFDGTNIDTIIYSPNHLEAPQGLELDLDQNKIYWVDYEFNSDDDVVPGKIVRSNFDGSNKEVLINEGEPADLALNLRDGIIYWTDIRREGIFKADLNGNNVELLVSTIPYPNPMAIFYAKDEKKIYWTNRTVTMGQIYRVDTEGIKIETLVDTNGFTNDVAVVNLKGIKNSNLPLWIKTYPNPVRKILHVENSGGYNELFIYNSSGALCLKEDFVPKLLELDISQLASGVYFLSCRTTAGEVTTTRFVKVD